MYYSGILKCVHVLIFRELLPLFTTVDDLLYPEALLLLDLKATLTSQTFENCPNPTSTPKVTTSAHSIHARTQTETVWKKCAIHSRSSKSFILLCFSPGFEASSVHAITLPSWPQLASVERGSPRFGAHCTSRTQSV